MPPIRLICRLISSSAPFDNISRMEFKRYESSNYSTSAISAGRRADPPPVVS